MKIENNGISPLASKPTDPSSRIDKKDVRKDAQAVGSAQDQVSMSGNGRLLAKARVALGNVQDINIDRLATLKTQIANGDYTVKINDLARKLVARFFPK